jgi:hypothetical protein
LWLVLLWLVLLVWWRPLLLVSLLLRLLCDQLRVHAGVLLRLPTSQPLLDSLLEQGVAGPATEGAVPEAVERPRTAVLGSLPATTHGISMPRSTGG